MSLLRQFSAPYALAAVALILVIASAPAGAQLSLPDGVTFVDTPTMLRAGGATYQITVQLKIHDANYTIGGTGVYFESDNLNVLDIGRGSFAVADASGRASLNVTTGNATGNTTVTAVLMSTDGDIKASQAFVVKGFGNITGTVVDADGRGIPGVTVMLYMLNDSRKGDMAEVEGNPALTSGTDSAVPGAYAINDVSYGEYYLEAIKDNQIASMTLSVSHREENGSIALQGYYLPTPTPTPSPTPVPTPTATTATAGPTPEPTGSTGDSAKQAAWIVGTAIVLAAIIILARLIRQKKPKK